MIKVYELFLIYVILRYLRKILEDKVQLSSHDCLLLT